MLEMRLLKKILKNLDELETQYQELTQETRLELERDFEGGTLILLKGMQRNFLDMMQEMQGR